MSPLECAQVDLTLSDPAAVIVTGQVPVTITVPACLKGVPPPPVGAAWMWGPLTPTTVAGTAYNTASSPCTAGMAATAHTPGQIEQVRLWRQGADLTASRRIGLWWTDATDTLRNVTVHTDTETRAEGWVTLPISPPVQIVTDQPWHAEFIVLAEVPAGSGFYYSPWTDSTTPNVAWLRNRGTTGPAWPPPNVYPSTWAPGIATSAVTWVDLYYRPT